MTDRARSLLVAVAASLLIGCGGDGDGQDSPPPSGGAPSEFERRLAEAADPKPADFPPAGARSLEDVAATARTGPQLGLATSVFVPGENRFAFGLIGKDNSFIYAKSAVYVAPTPQSRAEGPFPAPADALVTEPEFRSRTAAREKDVIAAVYAAQVPFKRPGKYSVVVLAKIGGGLQGATSEVEVARDSPIPAVGERPPAVETDTLATARGNVSSIDTRVPPARELHRKSFKDVVGRKPVAMLFATPQLCQSRVCGPVVDIAAQMQAKYGDRMEFIHQEVYVDNEIDKGLRAPLRAFNLQTEPWLFTVDADGRVAARLEGSFGVRAFEQAVNAGLR